MVRDMLSCGRGRAVAARGIAGGVAARDRAAEAGEGHRGARARSAAAGAGSARAGRDRLRDELDAAQRAAKRQAAPFSKGKPSPTPRQPGRKPGRDYGPRRWRPPPAAVDQVVDVSPPAACPHCGDRVVDTGGVRVQYQADLPPVRPHVTAFRCHVGRCQGCRRPVVGRDARQTSTATGAAASQVGPHAVAWAAWLHTGLGIPLAKVATILRTGFGLTITAGGLAQALQRDRRHEGGMKGEGGGREG